MGTYAIAHNRKYGMNVDTKYDKKGLDNQKLAPSVRNARHELNNNNCSFVAVRIRRIIFLIVEVVDTWQGLFFGHSVDVGNYKITPKATDHKVQLSIAA